MINFKHFRFPVLVLIGILIVVMISNVKAETSDVNVKINFAPAQIESKAGTYEIGYLSVVNENYVPITAPSDIEIKLTSSNPDVASVPVTVNIPKDHDYAKFAVTVGKLSGEVQITATFEDQTVTQSVTVG